MTTTWPLDSTSSLISNVSVYMFIMNRLRRWKEKTNHYRVEKKTRFSHCTKAQYARISHNMNRSQKMKTHRLKRGFPLLILSTARTRVDCQRNHKCTCAVVVNSWEDRMCLCSESKKRQGMGCWRRDESSCTHNPTVGHRLNWAWSRERLLNCPLGLNDLPSSASC